MALDINRLKNSMKGKIEAAIRSAVLGGDATPYPQLTQVSEALAGAIADAVVTEIKNNAAVSVTAATVTGSITGTVAGSACAINLGTNPLPNIQSAGGIS